MGIGAKFDLFSAEGRGFESKSVTDARATTDKNDPFLNMRFKHGKKWVDKNGAKRDMEFGRITKTTPFFTLFLSPLTPRLLFPLLPPSLPSSPFLLPELAELGDWASTAAPTLGAMKCLRSSSSTSCRYYCYCFNCHYFKNFNYKHCNCYKY